MAKPIVFNYHEGDQLPRIFGLAESTPITGFTIELKIERPDGSIITKAATIDDGPNGNFSFPAFAPTDLVPGNQRATIVITNGSAEVDAEELYLHVSKKVG